MFIAENWSTEQIRLTNLTQLKKFLEWQLAINNEQKLKPILLGVKVKESNKLVGFCAAT